MNKHTRHAIVCLHEASSTNTYVSHLLDQAEPISSPTTFVAHTQTAGRGQVGNRWHASPGLNLTFTTFVRHHHLPASQSFAVSILASLAAFKCIGTAYDETPRAKRSIKWPNDLYVAESKIGGILIEHSLTNGLVDHSLIGIGINVNETNFPPELPNPTSIRLLRGRNTDTKMLLETFVSIFDELAPSLYTHDLRCQMLEEYLSTLYRREGMHLYSDAQGLFAAQLITIQPSGHIILRRKGTHTTEAFAFGQISFVPDNAYPERL